MSARSDSYPTPSKALLVLTVLVVASIFSYVDRTVVSLLVGPIRDAMGIDDLQMSYLLGPSFALFYAVMGVPLGWAVDRTHRLRLAAIGVALWSLMTIGAGFANEFWHLFAARVGVAVGEAVLLPAATSLIADCFPARTRSRMLGVFGMSMFWGAGMSLLFGGLVISAVTQFIGPAGAWGPFQPWQLVFVIVGAPGLVVALALAMLREPARQTATEDGSPIPSTSYPKRKRATLIADYAGLFVAFGLMTVICYACLSWGPTHLVRAFGWTAAKAGVWLGLGTILFGTAWIWAASSLADRLAMARIAGAKYRIAAGSALIALPATIALHFVESGGLFAGLLTFAVGAAASCVALAPAAVHEITPASQRGRTLGAYQMVVALIGAGLGPVLVALVAKSNAAAEGGLGTALAIVTTAGFLLSAIIFLIRRPAFVRAADLIALQQPTA